MAEKADRPLWNLPAVSLLEDGLGDTVRVSLTEDPVAEIPVARRLVEPCNARWTHRGAEVAGAESSEHGATSTAAGDALPSP